MERFIYKNANGGTVAIGYDKEYILLEYEGLTATEILPNVSQGYHQNGYTLNHIGLGTRVVSIRFMTSCPTMEETYEKRRFLAGVFNPLLKGELIYENDYLRVALDVVVSAQPQAVERMGRIQHYEVELTAYNPFFRDVSETSLVMAGFAGGISFPFQIPQEGDGSKFAEISALTKIPYKGDIEAPIKAVFTGACQYPILQNVDTGEHIQVNQIMEEGEQLIITTGYGNKTAKHIDANGNITDAYHLITLDSSFFGLKYGTNKITFTAYVGTPTVTLSYYNWYVGV